MSTPFLYDELDVEIQCHPKFRILYKLPKDVNVVVLIGGRGGMKTYEASKFIAYQATMEKKRCVVLRDEKEKIRESILNEILTRFDTADEDGLLSAMYERLDTGIKDRQTKESLVFTQGFRASTKAKKSNLKGVSQVDIALVEEAEDIRNEDQFNTFHDSIRKEGSIVMIMLNTPDLNHWILKRLFNAVPARDQKGNLLDGYFEINPKDIPGFLCIKTSYKDNNWLPEATRTRYNGYGDPLNHLYNPFHYYTAIMGLSTTGRKGQILTKVKPIKRSQYMALPFKEIYGQDWGTASPAGLVGVKFDKNNCYVRQMNYLPMSTLEIGRMYARLGFGDQDEIVPDSAEPATIEKLSKGWKKSELSEDDASSYPQMMKGFYLVDSEPKNKAAGIGLMQSLIIHAVEEDEDLWNEIHNWVYAVDKNNQPTGQPVDEFDHLMDPLMYVIQKRKGKGLSLKGKEGLF